MSYKVLVIDDNKDMRDLMKVVVQMQGCEVFLATNGQTGLDLLKNESVHLIIVDHNMDIMDGARFTFELQKQFPDISSSVPVVMLTANDVRSVRENIATEVIMKNGCLRTLEEMIRRYKPRP